MKLQITVDCADPARLIPFWCAALGYVPASPPAGHDTWRSYYLSIGETEESLGDGDAVDRVVDPDGVRPPIWFQVVPEPKIVKNRVHLDVLHTDRTAPWPERHTQLATHRDALLALGGSLRMELPDDPTAHLSVQLLDPEGNEVCFV